MDMLCMIESLDLIPQICGCVVVLNGFLTLSKWYVSIAHSVQRSPNDLDIPKRLLRLSKASSSTWRTVSMWHGCTKGKQLVLGRNLSMGIHALELIFLGWKWKLADLAKVLRIAHEIPVFIRKRCLQYLKMAYEYLWIRIKLLMGWDLVLKWQLFWLTKPWTRTEDKQVVGNCQPMKATQVLTRFFLLAIWWGEIVLQADGVCCVNTSSPYSDRRLPNFKRLIDDGGFFDRQPLLLTWLVKVVVAESTILLLEGDTPPFLSDWGCFNSPNHGPALHVLYQMWYMCLHIYKTCFSVDLVCERYDDMLI